MLALLAGIAIARRPARFIRGFLILLVPLALLDQSRWQPWVVQYAVMFGALLIDRDESAALHACRLFMICTYFYSGLEKLGHGFTTVLPDVLGPLSDLLHLDVSSLSDSSLLALAVTFALIECASGIMLAFGRTRRIAVVCLVLMHLLLLWWLGPLGTNWNYVVWPWNIAMIGLLVLLFWSPTPWTPRDLLGKHRYGCFVGVAFGILPILTLAGFWDSYLGFSLYTGNIKRAVVRIPSERIADLPHPIREYTLPDGTVDIDRWSYSELGVPIYPETRIFVSAGKQVARWLGSDAGVRVVELGRPNPFTGERRSTTIDLHAR